MRQKALISPFSTGTQLGPDQYIGLPHVFDNHIQSIIYRILANYIGFLNFLAPNIVIGVSPKNPKSPYTQHVRVRLFKQEDKILLVIHRDETSLTQDCVSSKVCIIFCKTVEFFLLPVAVFLYSSVTLYSSKVRPTSICTFLNKEKFDQFVHIQLESATQPFHYWQYSRRYNN